MKGGYWWRKWAGCEEYWEGPEEKGYETRLPERSWDNRSHWYRQNQKKKADVVRARNKDGGKQTTGSSAIRSYGQVEGTRSRGRQPQKWIDNVKEDLTAQGINMREAVDNSRNRRIWRSLVEASSSANA